MGLQGLNQDQWAQAMQAAAQSRNTADQAANDTQLAKLRSYLSGQEKQKESDIDLNMLKKTQGMAPNDASSVQFGKAHIGADPMAHLMMQTQRRDAAEGQKLYGEAQKTAKPIDSQLQSLHAMHQLLDDPNSMDQKQLGANFARLTEGQGQRLLQSLVHELGAPPSLAGDAQGLANYISGAAKSTMTADQRNAMRQNLFKHQAEIQAQHEDAKNAFSQGAQLVAPDLTPDKHQLALSSAFGHSDKLLGDLNTRRQAFEGQQKAPVVPALLPQQQAQPTGMIDSGMSKLKNFLSPATTQPTQTPMSFEQWKASKGQK